MSNSANSEAPQASTYHAHSFEHEDREQDQFASAEHSHNSHTPASTLRAQLLAAEKRNLALRKELDIARAHAQVVERDFTARLAAAERFLLLKEKELRDTRLYDAAGQSGDDDRV